MIKISAIFLTILMLVSSISLSIDVHYCQNELKSIALFGKAKSCHDKKVKQSCHHSTKTSSSKEEGLNNLDNDNCCHNDNIIIEKSDLQAPNPEFSNLNNVQLKLIKAFIVSLVYCYDKIRVQSNYREYKPPLPYSSIMVLYQIFRI